MRKIIVGIIATAMMVLAAPLSAHGDAACDSQGVCPPTLEEALAQLRAADQRERDLLSINQQLTRSLATAEARAAISDETARNWELHLRAAEATAALYQRRLWRKERVIHRLRAKLHRLR